MLTIDGMAYEVLRSKVRLASSDGALKILGQIDNRLNTIVVDGTANERRQAEVLVHEILHAANPSMLEGDVDRASKGLYGILISNGLVPVDFPKSAIDRLMTDAEEVELLASLNAEAERLGGVMMATERSGITARTDDTRNIGAAGASDGTSGDGGGVEGDPPSAAAAGAGDGDEDSRARGPADSTDGNELLGEGGMKALKAERANNRQLTKQLAESQAKNRAFEKANMTATEQATADAADATERAETAETKLRDSFINLAFNQLAEQYGAIRPATVRKVIDLEGVEVDMKTGDVTGLENRLAAVKSDDPTLFGAGGNKPTSTGGREGTSDTPGSNGVDWDDGRKAVYSNDPEERNQQLLIRKGMGLPDLK